MSSSRGEAATATPNVADADADALGRAHGAPGPPVVGYMGPSGTFTEQALASQADLAALPNKQYASIPEVLSAIETGDVQLGFVPIENAIEGAVNVTQDALAFDLDLYIQREVILDVQLDLLGVPEATLEGIETVVSFPVALAQCRRFLRDRLVGVREQAANSTAEAAEHAARCGDPALAAVASPRSGELYGLRTLVAAVEDHPGNQTRFLLLGRGRIPPASGRDKTSIVVFQRANEPGSLMGILGEFAARRIDLSRLESRPTRQGLGDYCFLLDFEGHVTDGVVADCLADLKMKQTDVKFLGSYPAASPRSQADARPSEDAWRSARDWVAGLRSISTAAAWADPPDRAAPA